MTLRERAARAAAQMWADDNASRWCGAEFVEAEEGRAVMRLTVAPHHCNGHGICHGGVTFMLADSAFAYACNSRNQATVAQHNVISYLAPAKAGDILIAEAREVHLSGRNGIYDVSVVNQTGARVAELRGMSRAVHGTLFDE